MAKPIFTSKNATELLRYAEHIFLKMTENADLFPTPMPDLTELETRTDVPLRVPQGGGGSLGRFAR